MARDGGCVAIRVKELLGHLSTTVTGRYAYLAPLVGRSASQLLLPVVNFLGTDEVIRPRFNVDGRGATAHYFAGGAGAYIARDRRRVDWS